MASNINAYARSAFGINPTLYSDAVTNNTINRAPQIFAGGDYEVWYNNVQVGNLEALTYSSSIEVIGLYGMGSRDVRGFAKGKRVIVGSMSMQQYDRHALLEEVFQVTTNSATQGNVPTLSSLFENGATATTLFTQQGTANQTTLLSGIQYSGRTGLTNSSNVAATSLLQNSGSSLANPTNAAQNNIVNTSSARGLSQSDANNLFNQQLQLSVQQRALLPLDYIDMLPPFDITIVGVNDNGAMASCTIYGVQMTQETDGKSMNDLSPSIGMSFVAQKITPWRPITNSGKATGLFNL